MPDPGDGDDGLITRAYFEQGPAVAMDVPEGNGTPGAEIIGFDIEIEPDDHIEQLRWFAQGRFSFTIQQGQDEDPRLFPAIAVLCLQGDGGGVTPMQTNVLPAEPCFAEDPDNATAYNLGTVLYAWSITEFPPWIVGTNRISMRLASPIGAGHTLVVTANDAQFSVIEVRGGTLHI